MEKACCVKRGVRLIILSTLPTSQVNPLEFDRETRRFRDILTVILLQLQAKISIGVSYSTAGSVYKSQLTKSLIL